MHGECWLRFTFPPHLHRSHSLKVPQRNHPPLSLLCTTGPSWCCGGSGTYQSNDGKSEHFPAWTPRCYGSQSPHPHPHLPPHNACNLLPHCLHPWSLHKGLLVEKSPQHHLSFLSLHSPNLSSLSAPSFRMNRTMLHSARANISSTHKRLLVMPHMGIHFTHGAGIICKDTILKD